MEGDIETWPNYCIGSENASGEITDTADAFASPAHILNSAKRTENSDRRHTIFFPEISKKNSAKCPLGCYNVINVNRRRCARCLREPIRN
jgi:hypothetical protein